jgi:hypothetical protein
MSRDLLKAFVMLIYFDFYLAHRDFACLHERLRRYPVGRRTPRPGEIERVCSSVDLACIWYWKRVLCLQRSAAATCLLRRQGVPAQMVIGAQHLPFKAHAWVEVDGQVVNDKPYTPEMYLVLDRC